jgi:RNA polymerase sigma factor (sigma-70 family)
LIATTDRGRFEQAILPHLDAAYNLARWLTHSDHDAEDVVQDAYCRALKFFHSFRGGDARTWLLAVVRHAAYDWLARNRGRQHAASFTEEVHGQSSEALNPEILFQRRVDQQLLRQAIEELSVEFREVVVLRELEGLSYQEIAAVAGVPLGTVMSRLARARKQLQERLSHCLGEES